MNIHFILVESSLPENIGACARALKTMDFSFLRLVKPVDHLCDRAKWVAHGSVDILESAQTFSTLKQAIQNMDMVIGTTARKRTLNQNYYSCDQVITQIINKGQTVNNIGIVFGRENSGLTNQELGLCDLVSSIPMKTEFPSLNLAQSVMVYAHSLYELNINQKVKKQDQANQNELFVIKKRIIALLEKIGVKSSDNVHHRIIAKLAQMDETNIKLVHYLCKKLEKNLK
jgi:tRNA/rRNA methyltransferase